MSQSFSSDLETSTHGPLLIWYARCPTLTALGLAANRGILQREFLRESISMVSVRDNSTPSVRQGNLDHSLPNLIREADAVTALWAFGQHRRSRLLALGTTYHAVSIAVPQDSPIKALGDLIGHRLSVPQEAGEFSPAAVRALRGWESVLSFANIDVAKVHFEPVACDHPSVPFGDVARREIAALRANQSDCVLLFGAKGLELMRTANLREVHRFNPKDIEADPRLAGLTEQRALTVDTIMLEGRGNEIVRIVRNLLDIAGWAKAFPREALNQAAFEGQVTVQDTVAAYGDLFTEGLTLDLDPSRLEKLSELARWLRSRDLVPDLDITAWRSPHILARAEDKADLSQHVA